MRSDGVSLLVLAVASVLVLAGCSSSGGGGTGSGGSSGGRGTITIGLMADLTGTYQTYGYPAVNGALTEAKLINDAGGVKVGGKTYNIEFSICQTNSDPAQASACARKFVQQEGLKFVMGGTGPLGPPIAAITDPNSVMYWGPGSALANVLSKYKYAYSVLPDNNTKLYTDVEGVKKLWPSAKKIAFVTSDEPTNVVLPQLIKQFQDAGFTMTGQQSFSSTSAGQDLTAQLSAIADGHPDVIFAGWSYTEIAPVVAANEKLKITDKIFTSTGGGTCTLLKPSTTYTHVGSNDLIGADITHPANPAAKRFADAYNAYTGPNGPSEYKNQANTTTISSSLYFPDSLALLAKAMSDAGSVSDTTAISRAYQKTTVDGIVGKFRYTADRFAQSGLTACTLNIEGPGQVGSIYLDPPAS